MGLHCLLMSHKKDARLICVKPDNPVYQTLLMTDALFFILGSWGYSNFRRTLQGTRYQRKQKWVQKERQDGRSEDEHHVQMQGLLHRKIRQSRQQTGSRRVTRATQGTLSGGCATNRRLWRLGDDHTEHGLRRLRFGRWGGLGVTYFVVVHLCCCAVRGQRTGFRRKSSVEVYTRAFCFVVSWAGHQPSCHICMHDARCGGKRPPR